MICHFLTLI
jgi:hypothetical protein